MRLLIAYHIKDGRVSHYVNRQEVTAEEFRAKFREQGESLAPSLPQSTGFGYRIVFESIRKS